jgi:hypothetical protein
MIAGFCFSVKWPYYSPNRYKKRRNSVSHFKDSLTHQNILIYLTVNKFNG